MDLLRLGVLYRCLFGGVLGGLMLPTVVLEFGRFWV